jgi:hypothetical protein
MIDGLVAYRGGHSLADDMMRRRWRLAVGVAMGGLLCGFLWEFWNFWATPRWIYHVPLLDFGKIFEMPILGYGGYIPFAWSIYQLLKLRLGRAGRALHSQIGERRCDGLPAHVLRQAQGKGSKMPPHQVATLVDSLATTIDTQILKVSGRLAGLRVLF